MIGAIARLGGSLIGRLGSRLAKKGVIRGTAGKLLGGGIAAGAVGSQVFSDVRGGSSSAPGGVFGSVPNLPPYGGPGVGIQQQGVGTAVVRYGGGALVRGGAKAIARSRLLQQLAGKISRPWPTKVLKLIAAGVVFESGGALFNAMTGAPYVAPRRMNYANGRALSRAIKRFEGAAKQYSKVLRATKGKKCGGYTVTPKKRARRCA